MMRWKQIHDHLTPSGEAFPAQVQYEAWQIDKTIVGGLI